MTLASDNPATPWLDRVKILRPGNELVATRILRLTDDPVAEQHTLGGRRVSAIDPRRKGLPVLPFTVMLEMIAEAASALMPAGVVVGFRDVIAQRWIQYERSDLALELKAFRISDNSDEVHVQLFTKTSEESISAALFEGVVQLAPARPVRDEIGQLSIGDTGRCRFEAEELYEDQWLFHGPAFRALRHVGPSGPKGIEGRIEVLPTATLLPEGANRPLLIDAIVLDAFTHLLGCWGLDQLSEGDVVFPLRLGSLELFGERPSEGSEILCRIAIRNLEHHVLTVDAEILTADGRVWMRLCDWQDWRFYWPSRYRDQFRQPQWYWLGEPLALPGAPESAMAVWLEPPADMGRPVWRDVLEAVQLSPAERDSLATLGRSQVRRTLRLWGRIAVKEAVRRLWALHGARAYFPADLEIANDAHGKPIARPLHKSNCATPHVSIAHTEGVAVALAVEGPWERVGIDVEPIKDRSPGFEGLAFTSSERALLDRISPSQRAEWVARFWCAKEAAAKATGLGMTAGPTGLEVGSIDEFGGAVSVRLGTKMGMLCPDMAAAPIRVVTQRRGNFAWAWTMGGPVESHAHE